MNRNDMRHPWRWLALGALALCLGGCATWISAPQPSVRVPAASEAPATETYSYQHEVRKGKVAKAAANGKKYVVALARIADTSLVNTPFGDVVPLVEGEASTGGVTQINIQIDSATGGDQADAPPAGEPLKLKREANPWLGSTSRALLIDTLLETGAFDVLERDNINDIVREIEFGQSGYVDRDASAKAGSLKGVQYIIKGSFDLNPKAFAVEPLTPDNWLDDDGELPLVLMLRMYNVETGSILASGRGMGATREDAIVDAVNDLVAEL